MFNPDGGKGTEITRLPTNEEMEIMRKVHEWHMEYRHLFRSDIYGIDIEADLFNLVKSCIEIK